MVGLYMGTDVHPCAAHDRIRARCLTTNGMIRNRCRAKFNPGAALLESVQVAY